ncbi:hypothetical protein FFI97_001575 [Variovorax sp. KBS0712]|nr:hypothetical protein [Variovorax sp. KBS0712]TSD59047.1 hypothetical protein FFI97_001575 [Variovorax sp. KBS0712]
MTAGQPLAPYLSTLANKLVTHDHLLVHWGVHHLHLEPLCTLDERGYVARADNLLFFRVNGADIHLIDILPHNPSPFAQDELVKIVDRNWPQLHQQMRGFTTRVLSPAQIKKLRKGNLNTAVQTDTRVVMPAFGATSAGRSLAGVLEADRIFADLRRLEGLVAENYERWFPRSSAWITNVRLVGVEKDGYNLVDGASGYTLQLERTS